MMGKPLFFALKGIIINMADLVKMGVILTVLRKIRPRE